MATEEGGPEMAVAAAAVASISIEAEKEKEPAVPAPAPEPEPVVVAEADKDALVQQFGKKKVRVFMRVRGCLAISLGFFA